MGREQAKPTVLSLFSGAAGGWDFGLARAGFRTVAACEADPWRRAVFSQNFPDVRIYDDVRTLTAARLVSDLGYRPDVIVASPPCQDASSANTQGRGVDGKRTGLIFEAIRIIDECRPRWCALENVPGLRTRGADRVLSALEGIDYSAWPFVVGADDIGANHRRKRVWIIAFDPAQIGRDGGRAWRHGPHGDGAAYPASSGEGYAADTYSEQWRGRAVGGDGSQAADLSCDTECARSSIGESIVRDDEPQRQAAERAIGMRGHDADADSEGQSHGAEHAEMGWGSRVGEDAGEPWSHWNGGLAASLFVDDGVSARVAEHRGLAGSIVAAFGDAVVPQIPFAIGKAIWRVEAELDAAMRRGQAK